MLICDMLLYMLCCASVTKLRCISNSVSLWSLPPTHQMNVEIVKISTQMEIHPVI